MGSRLLIEILILLSPFAIYGLYRMAIAEAAAEGRKPWPIQRLFIIGFAFAIVTWFALLVWDKRANPDNRDVRDIGIPASDDPGGPAPTSIPNPQDRGDE